MTLMFITQKFDAIDWDYDQEVKADASRFQRRFTIQILLHEYDNETWFTKYEIW